MAQQSFKERIRSGERLFGASIPMHADVDWLRGIVARRPYDFVSVDAQHSAFSEHTLEAFCTAAGEVGVPVWFRIKHTRFTFLVGNFLDLGPHAIEIPQVEQVSHGRRGGGQLLLPTARRRAVGAAGRDSASPTRDLEEYAALWERTGALAMQIESVAATTAARRLAKDGVDFFSIGPADMTLRPAPTSPTTRLQSVDDCVRYLVRELEGTGIRVCMRTMAGDDPAPYHDMGVTMILESGVS